MPSPIPPARPATPSKALPHSASSPRSEEAIPSASAPAATPRSRRGADASDDSPSLPAKLRGRPRGVPALPPEPMRAISRRDPLHRMWMIHQILAANWRKAHRAEDLAREVGTGERNVRRDLASMQHTFMLPIESRQGNGGGFRYTRPNVEFIAAAAAPSELLALAIAAQMVRAYAGTRVADGVRGALRRLRSEVRAGHGLDLDALADVLSFRGMGFDLITDRDLFEKLTLAALQREELRFAYQGTEDLQPRERTVEPWRLFCEDNAWYLRAWDAAAGGIRHFCLGRMETVRATGRRFVRTPKQQKADADFDDALGAFGGGPQVRVVLRFRGRAAGSVRRRSWHHSQQVRVLGPKETELELRVADNPGLLHFALRWGADARVLEPASLREKVLEHARAMLAQG